MHKSSKHSMRRKESKEKREEGASKEKSLKSAPPLPKPQPQRTKKDLRAKEAQVSPR